MQYLFDDLEKNIIQKLKNSEPIRIWTEFVKVIFEFNDSYVELECIPEKADTQNKDDEAMTVKVREVAKNYEPPESAKMIVENDRITDVKTVRTLLYFTNSITEPEIVKKLDAQFSNMLSKATRIKKRKIDKIFEGTSGGYHREILCKPNSKESKSVKMEFSNLIDAGLLIEIGDEYLAAFVKSNGFGFAHLERKPLLSYDEMIKGLDEYELI